MTKTKAIFFDWMKTLGDYKDVIDFNDVLTKEQLNKLLLTKNFDDFEIDENKRHILFDALNKAEFNLYEDSLEIIKKLKENGFRLCIVSNTYCITPNRLKELFGDFLDYFDVISFSSELGIKKPNKSIFEFTLRELNKINNEEILPKEVIMVGDNEKEDIYPAQNLGIKTMLINRKEQNLKDLFSHITKY